MDSLGCRITRHESEFGVWERASGQPDTRLAPFVEAYEGYREHGGSFLTRLEVAVPKVVLVINFGAPYQLSGPLHPAGTGEFFGSFIAGLSDSYTQVASDGPAYTLQVYFTPLGAFRFFGMPMHQLANRVVTPGDIDSALSSRFIEQLYDAPGWAQRFALLDDLLVERFARTQDHSTDMVAWAWRQLRASHGTQAIGVLAEEACGSHKRFISRFREQIGLPPKTLARLLRFDYAVASVKCGAAPDWPALARACGYFDQAHFSKDFRRFAGVTPGDFRRRVLPGDAGVLAD
jgi:AraC-like DNA-binding protein